MVLKLSRSASLPTLQFENDVKMYGTQACTPITSIVFLFENDVKMYGTQACSYRLSLLCRLRMM